MRPAAIAGEEDGDVWDSVVARAALRAWEEAPVDWRAALLAVDRGVQAFMDWVAHEVAFRLTTEHRNDWTVADGRRLAELSGSIWVDDTTRVTATLVDLLVYRGGLRAYAAWLRSGWLEPSTEHLEHLMIQQGIQQTLASQQREQQVQWVEALADGRLIEWEPRLVRRVPHPR